MMAPLYWSRVSGPYCNCIDISTVNIRGPSFHNISPSGSLEKFVNCAKLANLTN